MKLEFFRLSSHPEYFVYVKKGFERYVEPKYGDQAVALDKIIKGNDRECEVMVIDDEPKGLIVFKKELQNEYGLTKAFELKTVFLLDHVKYQGAGKYLFQRIYDNALAAKAEYVYCSVLENDMFVSNHFLKCGWTLAQVVKTGDNGVNVNLVYKRL